MNLWCDGFRSLMQSEVEEISIPLKNDSWNKFNTYSAHTKHNDIFIMNSIHLMRHFYGSVSVCLKTRKFKIQPLFWVVAKF